MEENKMPELKEKVVAINRVAKVVKGGRTFRFSAVVVVGDGAGHVGIGNGKAAEVPDAIKKAIQEAKKNLVEVPIVGTTVPHEFVGKFGSAKVMLKPAAVGTGLITGGSVRPVLELAGYKDVRTKVIGTNNPRNVVYATIEGLKSMQTIEQVAKKRNKKVEEIAKLSTGLIEEYVVKLEERINEILKNQEIDKTRLAQEVVIYADKCSIEEEVTRLNSHISQFKNLLNSNEAIGKKLDFIIQEMNRETNTIGSKANNLEITNGVIDIKTEIENIREQVQNIE